MKIDQKSIPILLDRLGPELPRFFSQENMINSAHGVEHHLRTAFLAESIWVLLDEEDKDPPQQEPIFFAAMTHDMGRTHERTGPGHGVMGSFRCRQFVAYLKDIGLFKGSADVIDFSAMIVVQHCRPGPGDYLELQVVRDADKLERMRSGGRANLDASRLCHQVSKDLIPKALEFIESDPEHFFDQALLMP